MASGQHRPGYRRPRTGEKRRVRQPLKIDLLPAAARDRIVALRAEGKTWAETAQATGLPVKSLHTWYDLRVEQVQAEVMKRAERARILAGKFLEKDFGKLTESFRNALATEFFALLEAEEQGEQARASEALTGIGKLIARMRMLDLQQEKYGLERQKLERLIQGGQKLAGEIEQGKLKDPKEVVRRLREELGLKA